MLSISKDANVNYLAKIVQLKNIRKHENADKLQIAVIDFQNVVVELDQQVDDICIYFPVECQIHVDFLSFINAFREKTLNKDPEQAGFFEKNGRVRAVKLRGEKSMGFIIPIQQLEQFTGEKIKEPIGTEFNMLNDIEFVRKYEIKIKKNQGGENRHGKVSKRISRLVDGQFHFHIDTTNLRKNIHMIKPDDIISITYKMHGCSAIFANVLVKRKLNWFEKILLKLGVNIKTEEYDNLYSSRRVIKNEYETKDTRGFYNTDIWGDVHQEICGYCSDQSEIQKGYNYVCEKGQHKLFVYRITETNPDGKIVFELNTNQIREFCERYNMTPVHLFYQGLAKNLYPHLSVTEHWHENFLYQMEKDYCDKPCFMNSGSVPEEGVVLRVENSSFEEFRAYKLKSFSFLEYETKQFDAEISNIEDEN